MTSAPAGWYPNGEGWETWWDGTGWHDQHRPVPPAPEQTPVQSDVEDVVAQAEPPTTLSGSSGMTVERTDEGLRLSSTTWAGRNNIGGPEKFIPWADLLTLEFGRSILTIRASKTPISFAVSRKQLSAAPLFVSAAIAQHHAVTGRSLGAGGKLKRAQRAELMMAGTTQGIVGRLGPIREAIEREDVQAERELFLDLVGWAEGQGIKGAALWVHGELDDIRLELGLPELVFIAQLGNISVYEDRIIRGLEAHRIDAYTEAQVFLDGQKQVTTRPSLTAALVFAPLPGTALIGAQRFGNDRTHDSRKASFHVGSTGWMWAVSWPPDAIAGPRSVAQRINALAQAVADQSADATASGSNMGGVLDQLERIGALEATGAISSEQAAALKAKLVEGA